MIPLKSSLERSRFNLLTQDRSHATEQTRDPAVVMYWVFGYSAREEFLHFSPPPLVVLCLAGNIEWKLSKSYPPTPYYASIKASPIESYWAWGKKSVLHPMSSTFDVIESIATSDNTCFGIVHWLVQTILSCILYLGNCWWDRRTGCCMRLSSLQILR